MTLPPGRYAAALVMVIVIAVILRRWARARLQAAQWRLASETWREITLPVSPAAGAPDWPDGQAGMMRFFGTDYVPYDPAADAAVYCEALAGDVRDWIAGISRRARDDSLDVAGPA